MQSIKELIDARAELSPDKVFLHVAETDEQLTYGELRDHCQKISVYLETKNIQKGETVAFLMDNGYWTTCLFLGVMYSGRIVLALNAVAGPDQLNYIIEHSELKLIFCSEFYANQYEEIFEKNDPQYQLLLSDEANGNHVSDELKNHVPTAQYQEATIHSSDIALMIYTSGTTGRPKGVLLSNKNVITGGNNTVIAHGLTEDDISLCVLPLYHINAEMVSVMAPLISNSSVVMSRKLSITQFWHWISEFRCTWFSAVPTIFSYLLEHRQREITDNIESEIDFKALSEHLRFGRSASAALSPAVHQEFEDFFGINIVETMGISECSAQILSNPVKREVDYYGSPGKPVGNEMRIVDSNHQTVEANVKGELAVRGDNIMQGYFKNTEATEESLDADGWFYTGDLGYCNDDGYYFVTGRSKELIIRGGENIAPREIDDILYKRAEVLEAAAFGVPSDYYGQEVLACVSLKPGSECTEEVLLDHCKSFLGKIKSPKRIHIINELPKGPSGKIQRLKLAERVFD
jgi:acyl-CoA synthetase (AMP-forming)/AMP-acid ligase II